MESCKLSLSITHLTKLTQNKTEKKKITEKNEIK